MAAKTVPIDAPVGTKGQQHRRDARNLAAGANRIHFDIPELQLSAAELNKKLEVTLLTLEGKLISRAKPLKINLKSQKKPEIGLALKGKLTAGRYHIRVKMLDKEFAEKGKGPVFHFRFMNENQQK